MKVLTTSIVVLTLLFQGVMAEESVLTRLYQFLQEDKFSASFVQQVYDERNILIDDSTGRFVIHRPSKFRWEYNHPSRQIILSDGINFLNYDPELEQATIQPLTVSLGYAPIMLLLEKHPSFDNFTVDVQGRSGELDWITLVPKVQDMEFNKIELGLSAEGIVKIKMQDHFNQQTTIDFLALQYDIPEDSDPFKIYLPKGTDVIGDYLVPPKQQ